MILPVERFYFAKLVDRTRLEIRPQDYIHDVSLKGEFVRRVMASSLTEAEKEEIIGVSSYFVTPGFFEGIGLTFKTFGEIIVLMFQAIGSLFTKEGFSQVGGPVQVYSVSTEMASEGFLSYMWFLAIISVNLGFFNLLNRLELLLKK